MAKTTTTVTPAPLTDEQAQILQQQIDLQSRMLDTFDKISPTILAGITSGASGLDLSDQILRSAGLYSDEVLATAGFPRGSAQATLPAATGVATTASAPIDEATQRVIPEFLDNVYRGILNRAPDPEGLQYWSQRAQEGMPLGQILQTFQNVAESGTDPLAGVRNQTPAVNAGMGLAPATAFPAPYRSAPFDPEAGFENITNIENAAITAGQKNIDRFARDSLELMREELAPQLGLRSRDTPILDRGGRLMQDVTRQKADLAEGILAQGAQLRLDYPLNQYKTLSDVGVNEGRLGLDTASLAESARQFNNELGLRNRALGADIGQRGIENRFRSAEQLMNRYNFGVDAGLNLLSVGAANRPDFGERGTTTSSKESGNTLSTVASVAGGLGGLASGIAKVGKVFGFSSRDFKDVIEAVSPEKALEGIASTPITKWVYKGEDTEHIGPMAEDFQKAFGVGDGRTIDFIDAIGVLFAAVQALDGKLKEIAYADQ